ncbi:MerR HTH family regulatory protein [Agreia bicolorata]|uniref:MerR HTH family regulatory protein n=1 Tax=Agreia bicolorata TaxID=110935 RepID=A0A1T4YGS2_9MICO|nr:MerR family transcriptional regulator [Agreia bicolorata]SKB00435.1 MerR HTH family regulatory protein [Agreia bicolorata]
MDTSFTSPRYVTIDDAAAFVGTTPHAIRQYHETGLLPEPGVASGDTRHYGYDDVIRLLWIGKRIDAGIDVHDIHDAADSLHSNSGLLSDFVTDRLKDLPPGFLRQADLDSLLVMERIFGPLGAAVNATRYVVMAAHPDLREEADRVDAAEEALDDSVAVDDPRVAQAAAQRFAFDRAMDAAMESSDVAQIDDESYDAWEALHDFAPGQESDTESALRAVENMPYDWSPARQRYMKLVEEMHREVWAAQ